jgi:hypothetical protein
MKVFVYNKDKNSKKIATIENVASVTEDKANRRIYISTGEGVIEFDTKFVKTSIYQN